MPKFINRDHLARARARAAPRIFSLDPRSSLPLMRLQSLPQISQVQTLSYRLRINEALLRKASIYQQRHASVFTEAACRRQKASSPTNTTPPLDIIGANSRMSSRPAGVLITLSREVYRYNKHRSLPPFPPRCLRTVRQRALLRL